jgi:branched-chain amino acid transport system permease protein
MERLLQSLIDGVMQGSVLSLAAIGFSLIFGVLGVVNLSHGALVILGAYLALFGRRIFGIDPLVAIPAVAALLFAFGYAYQRFCVHPAIKRSNLLSSLLVTYGVALLLQNGFTLLFSPDVQSLRPSYANAFVRLGGVTFNLLQISAFAVSLVLIVLLSLLLNRSTFGRIVRATAEQEMAARLCGVNIEHVYAMTFGFAAAFAGVAGVLIGMLVPFSPATQDNWTIYGFVVVVLGGIGSASGALLGGLLLGLIATLTTQLIGPAFPNAMMFFVLVAMLLLRPNGLLGNAFGGSR